MKNGTFAVYQHLKETKQGKNHRWYYYYYTVGGKKVQKACKNCATKEQAEAYVEGLATPVDARARSRLIADIAKDMFLEGSAHMERRRQLGKSTYQGTIKESRRFVETIIRQWGGMELKDLAPETVMAYLFSVDKAGKWKNKLAQILNEVYSEAIVGKSSELKPCENNIEDRPKKRKTIRNFQAHTNHSLCYCGFS